MKKVLITVTNYSKYCQAGKKLLLDAGFELIENPYGRPYTFEELEKIISDVDGIIAGIDTWNEAVFRLAPSLKIIARFGVGIDNIDVEAAKRYNIRVTNCPGINSTAVAEQAVSLILCLTRQIVYLNRSVRAGEWTRFMAHELKSQTVGFLGFGAVAREAAKHLSGFECTMLAYDKYPDQETADKLQVQITGFDEVIKNSDIISLHLPALDDTFEIINAKSIEKMKDGVILINTARGSLVDEKALYEALKLGKIAGVGTDVFAKEPVNASNPLFEFEQYVALPHTSAETYENCEDTSLATAGDIIDCLSNMV